jgi:hypothetical protein
MVSRLLTCIRKATVLAAATAALASPCHAVPEPDLTKGIRQAQEGEYQAAEVTLRAVIERLSGKPESEDDLARAYVYLAVACVGSNRESAGREAFLEALKLRPDIETSSTEFPPSFTQFFDTVREEAWAAGTVARPEEPGPEAEGHGGKAKWLLIGGGLAVAGGGAALVLTRKSNTAPTAGQIAISPGGMGISNVTRFTLSATGASDPDGDTLTFEWNLGDDSRDSGTNVSHVYGGPATFNITLNVSDGEASVSASASVTTLSLSGVWVNELDGVTRTWAITQVGQSLEGTYHNSYYSPTVGTGVLSGTVSDPRAVNVESSLPGVGAFRFEGVANEAIDELTGQATGAGLGGATMVFRRQ